ncbi:MAG: hypothetical protein JW764_02510 [Chlorobiaceae bacterium]|nr:hypothetical protein [Chlorobiaceae bacterium]
MTQNTNHQPGNANTTIADIIPGITPYALFFEDDTHVVPDETHQLVKAETIEEAIGFLQLLGDACIPVLSPEYRLAHPELYKQLMDTASSWIDDEAPMDIDTAAAVLKKLPLDLKNLINSPIAIKPDDLPPAPIQKSLVHKENETNVLISEPFSTGWLRYFNIYSNTDELVFDHPSDHVQGMLIIEAMRQTGIAMAHLQGLPCDGRIALLSFNTSFYNFVERDAPVILRAYSSFTANPSDDDKKIEVFVQLIQWGRICTESKLKGHAFMNAESSGKKEALLAKISMRNQRNFDEKVNSILEKELSE